MSSYPKADMSLLSGPNNVLCVEQGNSHLNKFVMASGIAAISAVVLAISDRMDDKVAELTPAQARTLAVKLLMEADKAERKS